MTRRAARLIRVLARNLSPLIGSSRGSPNPPLVAQYFNSAPPKIFTLLLLLLSLSAHTQIQAITLCSKFIKCINCFISYITDTFAQLHLFSKQHYLTQIVTFQNRHHGVSQRSTPPSMLHHLDDKRYKYILMNTSLTSCRHAVKKRCIS